MFRVGKPGKGSFLPSVDKAEYLKYAKIYIEFYMKILYFIAVPWKNKLKTGCFVAKINTENDRWRNVLHVLNIFVSNFITK